MIKRKKRKSHLMKALDLQVKVLSREARDPYTKRLGPAAVKSVKETLAVVRKERARVARIEQKRT